MRTNTFRSSRANMCRKNSIDGIENSFPTTILLKSDNRGKSLLFIAEFRQIIHRFHWFVSVLGFYSLFAISYSNIFDQALFNKFLCNKSIYNNNNNEYFFRRVIFNQKILLSVLIYLTFVTWFMLSLVCHFIMRAATNIRSTSLPHRTGNTSTHVSVSYHVYSSE